MAKKYEGTDKKVSKMTRDGLTEENLRAFIERNLSTINAGLGTNLTTVDEGITFATQLEDREWLQYETKYMQTYYTVLGLIEIYGVETTYDISLPEFIYQDSYWTLSHYVLRSDCAWHVDFLHGITYSEVSHGLGVRPVITISKSNLSK